MKPEKIDNVNKPSHYQGSKGLESIEVIEEIEHENKNIK